MSKVVALVLFLVGFVSSELELCDALTESTRSFEIHQDKPLPIKLISSMQYESVCVNIYDQTTSRNNKKTYFYSPIALLNHMNVVSIYNQTTTRGILSISFSIWNQDVDNKVAQHLSQVLDQQVDPNQVQVFPFNSVRLSSAMKSSPVDFSLTNEWLPYNTQQSLRFTVTCLTRNDCDRVKTRLRMNPEQFEHLRLDFNPQLNDDPSCSDKLEITQEVKLSRIQVQETKQEILTNIETRLAKELKAIREEYTEMFQKSMAEFQLAIENLKKELQETKKDFATTSQITKVEELSAELNVTKKELEATKMALDLTRIELKSINSTVSDLSTKLNARTSEIIDVGKMPTSCEDLQRMGHKLSGIFLVKGPRKMETIYCDFYPNENELQKWIGYADVKSAPVYFYVQRNSSFFTKSTPIPFHLAQINKENAMNLSTGKFTAPRPGIYFFSFSGLANISPTLSAAYLVVSLYLNSDRIGSSCVEEGNTIPYQYSPLTLQSTLNLKSGDQVWMEIQAILSGVNLYDDKGHYTIFTGFLLEEDIVNSL